MSSLTGLDAAMAGTGFTAPEANPNSQQSSSSLGAGGSWSFHAQQDSFISRGNGSEYYNEFIKHADAVIEADAANQDIKVALIRLPKEKFQDLRFSAAVLAVQFGKFGKKVAYHPMIIEGTGELLQDEVRNTGGAVVPYAIRATSDAYDSILSDLTITQVRRHFPEVAAENIYGTANSVVPQTFDAKNADKVRGVILNAGLACQSKLAQMQSTLQPPNLATLATGEHLVVKAMYFHENTTAGTFGEPIRSDQIVTVRSKRNLEKRDIDVINGANNDKVIAEVCGFTHPIFSDTPQDDANANIWNAAARPPKSRCWSAEYVMTNIAVAGDYQPGFLWLAILSAVSAQLANNNWMQSMKPNKQIVGKFDPRDPGFLNFESNVFSDPVAGYVNTKAPDFTDADLLDYLTKCFHPNLVISLDCVLGGPNSWFTNIFEAASRNVAGAKELLWNHLDILCNGRLAEYFPRGGDMFAHSRPILVGTWEDADRNLRPLDDFDQLRVEARRSMDRSAVHDWMDTYWKDADRTPAENLYMRKGHLRDLSGGTANFTHVGYRLTFDQRLLTAALQCMRDDKIRSRFSIEAEANNLNFNQQRASARFAQGNALGSNVNFLQFTNAAVVGGGQSQVGGAASRAW